MALPPAPLAEILALAVTVAEGVVEEVLSSAASTPRAKEAGQAGGAPPAPLQRVRLRFSRVLRGKAELREVVAVKPPANYRLRVGNKGPWLLDASSPEPMILGRYGPDSYSLAQLERALGVSR